MSTTIKATVNVRDLARAMREVAQVVKRATIPVTQNVLIETRDGRLRLTCFTLCRLGADLECARVREIPGEVHSEGATTVPAKLFRDLAKELRSGDLELTLERQLALDLGWNRGPHDVLRVHYQRLNMVSRIVATSEEEFPPLFRDIDLGDWGFLAPSLEQVAA